MALAALVGALALFAGVSNAVAVTRHVANSGIDSGSCGTAVNPCRSITQAIANALPNDSISVGPGIYGDVDGDGQLGDPGDEANDFCADDFDCMVRVDKSVKIFSTDGAGATMVRAPLSASIDVVFSIESAGVVLGKSNQGFTVSGGGAQGVYAVGADGIKVVGNRFLGTGVYVESSSSVVVARNVVYGDPNTDEAIGVLYSTGAKVTQNVVTNASQGLILGEGGIVATSNAAIGNGEGILVSVDADYPEPMLDRNSAIGNEFFGLLVEAKFTPTGNSTATVRRGNIFANGGHYNSAPSNCGVVGHNNNVDFLVVDAIGVFWGAGGGPGPNPADAISGGCNEGSGFSLVTALSPAGKNLPLKVPAQR